MSSFSLFLYFQIMYIVFSQITEECKKIKLDNIMQLGGTDFQHLSVVRYTDITQELILEASYDRLDISSKERVFYKMKPENYYYEKEVTTNVNDTEIKTINMQESINRGISQIIPFSIKDKYDCIFNLGIYSEIYNFNSLKTGFLSSSELFNQSIFSQRNSLILNDKNETIAGFISNGIFNLYKFQISDYAFKDKFKNETGGEVKVFPTYMVSCLNIFGKNCIQCLLRSEERKLILAFYRSDSLELFNQVNFTETGPLVPTYLFAKSIYLFDDLIAYAYYENDDSNPLLIIRKYEYETFTFEEKFRVEINNLSYPFTSHFNKNDIIKINDERFIFISVTTEDNISYNIILTVFTLFNDNGKLENRIYKIPFYNCYNIMPKNNIRLFSIGNYFGLGFTAENIADHEITTKFMFLNYINYTEISEPKPVYVCIYDNNVTLPVSNLSENFFISNNIFGLKIKNIKIINFPSSTDTGLIFYKNKNDEISKLEKNDEISIDDSLIITVTKKLNQNYTINYAATASEPDDYITYNSLSEGVFGDSLEADYSPKSYYGKLMYYKLNFVLINVGDESVEGCCHSNCEKCEKVGDDTNNKCSKCKNDLYLNSTEYFNEYPIIRNCYNLSDGYYINKTNNSNHLLSKCYKNCKTCSNSGNLENNNCTLCIDNYYKKENEKSNNCYDEVEENYFFNTLYDPPVFSECSLACKSCFSKENDTSTNCNTSSCNKDYNYHIYENDKTNCKNFTEKHYLDGDISDPDSSWQLCHSNCLSCFGGYDSSKDDMKCIKCLDGFIAKNGTNNCYENTPPHYYYNKKTKNYTVCSENCGNCSDFDICTSCDNGGTLDNTNDNEYGHPYCMSKCSDGKIYNPITKNCTDNCPSDYYCKYNQACINCYTYFSPPKYYNLDNKTAGCLDVVPDGYIYDPKSNDKNFVNFGIVQKCYDNCKTCSKTGSNSDYHNQNCLTCKNSLYLTYNSNNCFYYCDYYDDDNNYYDSTRHNFYVIENGKCINCKLENMNTKDKKIYKFLNDTKCIDEETAKKNSNFKIIDEDTGTIVSCHKNCKTCYGEPPSDEKENCETCYTEKGFYLIADDSGIKNCISKMPDGYYLDKENNEFKKCYGECLTCEGEGNFDDNKCLTCKGNYSYYFPKHQCVIDCVGYGYTKYKDECLDENCVYYNYFSKGEKEQLYYNPYTAIGEHCIKICSNTDYMFENVNICLDNCSDITSYENIYQKNVNYKKALQDYYLAKDDFFYSIIDNGNSKPNYCVSHFYSVENSTNKIKADNYVTDLFFNSVNNKTCTDYDLTQRLFNLRKILNFDYNNLLYNVEIGYNLYNSYSDEELSINRNCVLNDIFTIKYSIKKDELYSNFIYFDFYEKNINDSSCLVKKNIEDICPNFQYYTIRSPLNLDKFPLHLHKYFNETGYYDVLNPDDPFYEINCESCEYNDTDINLQTKIKKIYIKNVTQYNCSYQYINHEQKTVVENCSFYENDTKLLGLPKETKISKIEKNYYYKNNIIHIKIFTCLESFASKNLITNFLFYLGIILFIALIILIIIFYKNDIDSLNSLVAKNFNIKSEIKEIPQTERIEVKETKEEKEAREAKEAEEAKKAKEAEEAEEAEKAKKVKEAEEAKKVKLTKVSKKKKEKKIKKNLINFEGEKKYSYLFAVITNDPPKIEEPKKEEIVQPIMVDEQIPKKKKRRTLKNSVVSQHKRGIKNGTEDEKIIEDGNKTNFDDDKTINLLDIDPEQEYFEYDCSIIPKPQKPPKHTKPPKFQNNAKSTKSQKTAKPLKFPTPKKKYITKTTMIKQETKFYELKPKNNYQIAGLGYFLLTHIPITNIFFVSKNNTGDLLRFIFESHYLNVIFVITTFFTLGIFNTLFFSDNLFVINFEKKGLPVKEYISYSIIGAILNIVFGFLLMLIYYSAQNIKPKKNYGEEDFKKGIEKVISSYKCKVFGCMFLGLILGLLSIYYCSLFGNIYPNTKKYLFIQILLSFVFEIIFYAVIFVIIWLIIKLVTKEQNKKK